MVNKTQTKHYERPKALAHRLAISRTTLWAWAKLSDTNGFPAPIKMGEKITVFDSQAVDAWVQSKAGGAV